MLVGLLRRFFGHVVAAGEGAAGGVGGVVALPDCEDVAVDAFGVAALAPDYQERLGDLVAGVKIGLVHVEVAGRARAVIGA